MKALYPINGFLSYAFGERFLKVLHEVEFLPLLLKSVPLTVRASGVSGSPNTNNSRVVVLASFPCREPGCDAQGGELMVSPTLGYCSTVYTSRLKIQSPSQK